MHDTSYATAAPQEESTPRMERSAAASWKRSDSGLLSMCTQTCAQRRSQTAQALTAGGVPASSQAAGRLSATAGSVLRANTSGSEAVHERSRAGSRHALGEAVATPETEGRGGDSRAVAAHSHHRMMRMLASEQCKLPPAKGRMRNDVRVFRVDATAQVPPPFSLRLSNSLDFVSVSTVREFQALPVHARLRCHLNSSQEGTLNDLQVAVAACKLLGTRFCWVCLHCCTFAIVS